MTSQPIRTPSPSRLSGVWFTLEGFPSTPIDPRDPAVGLRPAIVCPDRTLVILDPRAPMMYSKTMRLDNRLTVECRDSCRDSERICCQGVSHASR
jgi:hypothetical protein